MGGQDEEVTDRTERSTKSSEKEKTKSDDFKPRGDKGRERDRRSRSPSPKRSKSSSGKDKDKERDRGDRDRRDRDRDRDRDRKKDKDRRDKDKSRSDRDKDRDGRKKRAEEEEEKVEVKKEKVEPLSLEELLEKKKKEEAEKAKPKFLTPEQRVAEALARRQAQVAEQRKNQQVERSKRDEFFREGRHQLRELEREHRDRDRDPRDRFRERERERERERRDLRKEDGSRMSRAEVAAVEKEKEAVKDRYLGGVKRKKKIRKLNDRKFVFDWDAGEDTSSDYNPIYSNKHQIQFFGRGGIGGIDVKVQKKAQGQFYGELVEQRRTIAEKDQERYVLSSIIHVAHISQTLFFELVLSDSERSFQ